MKPRLGSAVITLTGFCRDVYATTPEKWKSLPIQWRGLVMHGKCSVDSALALIAADGATVTKPQDVFDVYQGFTPA